MVRASPMAVAMPGGNHVVATAKATAKNAPTRRSTVKAKVAPVRPDRFRRLPIVKVTKQWLIAHIEIMQQLDWMDRHQLFRRLSMLLPEHCRRLALLLSPDELLTGSYTGTIRRFKTAIRLHDMEDVPDAMAAIDDDMEHPNGRQLKITDFFMHVIGI